MLSLAPTTAVSEREDTGCHERWQLRSGAPVLRRGLCSLAQPCLEQTRYMPRLQFHEATVLLIAAGRLELDDGVNRISVDASSSLLLVEPNTCADVLKTPGGDEQRFRSIFLTVPTALLDTFRRSRPSVPVDEFRAGPFREIPLDEDLASTLRHVLDSVDVQHLSDERLRYRLMDLLAALAERGHHFFGQAGLHDTSGRLRTLIAETPEQQWTAQKAGRALAMSEATLRRRLADERVRFEELLIDVRMHHAMMLVQTTSWNMPHIAQACGYKSSTRFAERFRARFGYLPSAVR